MLETEVAELQQRVAAAKDTFEAAAAKLAEKRARLAECDRELATLAAEKSDLQTKLADSAAERKRHTHRHAVAGTHPSILHIELVKMMLFHEACPHWELDPVLQEVSWATGPMLGVSPMQPEAGRSTLQVREVHALHIPFAAEVVS